MARPAVLALLFLSLLAVQTRSQDLNLADALGNNDVNPTPPPKKQDPDDDFNLGDALGDGGHDKPVQPDRPKPKPDPKPHQPGTSSDFTDSDLQNGDSGTSHGGGGGGGGGGAGGGGSPRGDGDATVDNPGVISSIVGAVVVAVAGAVSSFIAYQKKKLCFKEGGEQGDVSLENQQGPHSKPPAQRSLLEKV